jgi:hypothetical protein
MTDYWRLDELENIARGAILRQDYYFFKGDAQAVPIELIAEDYGLEIDFMRLSYNGDLLGRMIFDDGVIEYYNTKSDRYDLVEATAGTMMIESSLLDRPQFNGRLRFTIAHELAHWILHKRIFKGTKAMAAYQRSDKRTKNSIEFQANYLASAFLMPAPSLKRAYNQSRFDKCDVISKLAKIFEVSKEAMRIRLKELGLI